MSQHGALELIKFLLGQVEPLLEKVNSQHHPHPISGCALYSIPSPDYRALNQGWSAFAGPGPSLTLVRLARGVTVSVYGRSV